MLYSQRGISKFITNAFVMYSHLYIKILLNSEVHMMNVMRWNCRTIIIITKNEQIPEKKYCLTALNSTNISPFLLFIHNFESTVTALVIILQEDVHNPIMSFFL